MSPITGIRTSRLQNFLDFRRDPLAFLLSQLQEGEIVSLRTSRTRPTFIVNSPRYIQEILLTQDAKFRKGRSSDVLRRTIGDGLLTTEREEHARQRRYVQPAFYKERIQAYTAAVIEETEELAAGLAAGTRIELHEALMQLTLSIITRTMFGSDVGELKAELARAVNDTIERTAKLLFSPVQLPLSLPTPGNRVHRRAISTLESMVYEVIQHARSHPAEHEATLLGMLLETRDEQGRGMPDQEIRDQMMTMLLAGHETTANLLTWVFYELDRSPEAAAKLYAELDELYTSAAELSGFELYRRFAYLPLILQETLRLYPPAWIMLRESTEAVVMHGDPFPPRSSFLISPYALHRSPDVFADPLVFRPERFAASAPERPRFAYFPFGGGSRACIGSNFALMEATLILATLCRRFRFERAESGPVHPEPLVSLRIQGGLPMFVRSR